tara:strand:- start:74172 stop:75461 length:1290 start_codon:yes stop_codon:yes gene_type:complete
MNKYIFILIVLFSSVGQTLSNKDLDQLIELYEGLHQEPELSYQEFKTSKKLANILKELGFEVSTNFGGNGVVALLKNGKGKTVMIRADMDGLPIEEKTGVSYASKNLVTNLEGKIVPTMHACGHDIHMTVLIGVAKELLMKKDSWRGNLLLVLQPAEEVSGGARNMIKEGLFEKFPRPSYNLALHVSADLEAGKVGYLSGYAMANVDAVDITIFGLGGHGAYPHKTKDPIVLASQIINSLQSIVSREIAPIEPAVVTVGSIHGGSKHNIIPNQVKLQLTLRSYTDEVRNKIIASIKRISIGMAQSYGLPKNLFPIVEVKDEYTPAVYNNPSLVDKLQKSFEKSIGSENVIRVQQVMGGEDFGMYGRVEPIIPTALFWLGTVNKTNYKNAFINNYPLPSLHSDLFIPDSRPTIKTGIIVMHKAAIDLFNE